MTRSEALDASQDPWPDLPWREWGPLSDAPGPAFYAYTYPEPDGFRSARVRPAEAFFDERFGDFLLPYDAVRGLADPDVAVLDFFESTYEAGADLAGWDRSALEPARRPDRPPRRAWSTNWQGPMRSAAHRGLTGESRKERA